MRVPIVPSHLSGMTIVGVVIIKGILFVHCPANFDVALFMSEDVQFIGFSPSSFRIDGGRTLKERERENLIRWFSKRTHGNRTLFQRINDQVARRLFTIIRIFSTFSCVIVLQGRTKLQYHSRRFLVSQLCWHPRCCCDHFHQATQSRSRSQEFSFFFTSMMKITSIASRHSHHSYESLSVAFASSTESGIFSMVREISAYLEDCNLTSNQSESISPQFCYVNSCRRMTW